MTLREASNARSTEGAKSVLKPSARQHSPMICPCLRKSLRSPVANTSAADGAGPSTSRKRSTRPPSRSTHAKSRAVTHFWQSSRSRHVCSAPVMLRANRITPAGCSFVSRELSRRVISVPSKPTISSCPRLWMFEDLFFADIDVNEGCSSLVSSVAVSDFLFQLGQQIQRLQGREAV